MNFKNTVLVGGVLLAVLGSSAADAALGEPRASVQVDAAQLRGQVKVTQRSIYQVHEIQLPSGTQVREFTATDGKVFAVAWNGPIVPNLRQTLGQYFDTYVAGAKASRSGRHHLQINQGDLVMHAAGHMRAYSGMAYLPQALPSGVDAGDLK
jgi:hypothetical protein